MKVESGVTRVDRALRPKKATSYALVAECGTAGNGDTALLERCIGITVGWLKSRFPERLPDGAERGESFVLDDGGHRLECVGLEDAGLWAARLSHPDLGLGKDAPAVPGRHIVTDVAFSRRDGQLRAGVRVSCHSPTDCTAPVAFSRPRIVRDLASKVGLRDVRLVSEEPWRLASEGDVAELDALLRSTDRHMPIVVLSQPDKKRWTLTPRAPAFMMDGLWLGKQVAGYAHVVLMPYALGFAWTRHVGHAWSVFDGSVRIYMPGANLREDEPRLHPIAYKEKIQGFEYEEQRGGRAFDRFLADLLQRYGAMRRVSWDGISFVPEARMVLAERLSVKARLAADVPAMLEAHARELESLKKALQEVEAEAEQWSDAATASAKERDEIARENDALRHTIDSLRARLDAKSEESVDEAVPIPSNYDEMPDWVRKHLAGRLVLHPRAVNELRNACYQDVATAYRALLVLGNEYRSMRMGVGGKAAFDAAREKLELRFGGSIEKSRAGEQGDTYFVRYPVGGRTKRFLEFHLRKGSSMEKRYTLAVYFFWDAETRQVIVGWLPSHLENRMT
jgi:hypothetical protein